MRLPFIKVAAIVAGVLALGSNAHAVTTVYTSQSAFLAALTGTSFTNPFSTSGASIATVPFSGNGFSYNVTAPGGNVYRPGTFIGSSSPINPLAITSTGASFNAIGGEFFITDFSDTFLTLPVTITLSNGFVDTYTPTSISQFRGYIADTAITSLTMSASPADTYNSLDNVIVGNAAVATVPEAGTVTLLGLALPMIGGVAVARRKKK